MWGVYYHNMPRKAGSRGTKKNRKYKKGKNKILKRKCRKIDIYVNGETVFGRKTMGEGVSLTTSANLVGDGASSREIVVE